VALHIKERSTGRVIASGEENESVRVFEGNWYYKPEVVDMTYLRLTDRIYTCPYKGQCFWIDVETPDGQRTQNVAWVYRQPKQGYEFITDQIGFYARPTQATLAERSADQSNQATASLAK
jgi:uncharacterized protein (DUF427 family)